MIVVPSWIWPLQRAYRNRDRASRCLREPVGCVDSSLRYRSMSGNAPSGTRTRCVSADLLPSASTRRTASCTQARPATEVRSTSPAQATLSGVTDMLNYPFGWSVDGQGPARAVTETTPKPMARDQLQPAPDLRPMEEAAQILGIARGSAQVVIRRHGP